MEKVEMKATIREAVGKKLATFRREGKIPAVVYGHRAKNKNLFIDRLNFEKVYKSAGESTLIDLLIDKEKPVKVLIQDMQADPVSGSILHVDFHQVKMDEKITTEISLNFIGMAPAEKELGGILVKNLDKIKVECLPQYLIHELVVDVSKLKTFDDNITVKELPIPKEITVLEAKDEIVVHVLPPKSEEEIKKELEGEIEEKVEEVEVTEKGKKEEGVEEGEEAAKKTEAVSAEPISKAAKPTEPKEKK